MCVEEQHQVSSQDRVNCVCEPSNVYLQVETNTNKYFFYIFIIIMRECIMNGDGASITNFAFIHFSLIAAHQTCIMS